jgi:uroporphyrinogen-III synthase
MSRGGRRRNFERSARDGGKCGGRGALMTSVLVVRKFDNFSRILTENGFSVINCPAIETLKSENLHDLAAKISARHYDGIFLTSQKATEIASQELFCKNFNYRGKIYVLGKSSFERLKNKNLDLFFDARANTAQEMLEAIPPADLNGRQFLFIRGEKSRGTIREFLENRASFDEVIVYETRRLVIQNALKKEIAAKAKNGEIAAACFFSPSGAESFLEQFAERALHQTRIAAIGKTTSEYFAERDLRVDFITTKATAEDFAIELTDYLKRIFSRG